MNLSGDQLETHLFECADIIRDAVDPTDYKEYILPLVYYKAIFDEFQKQYEANLSEYGDEELARQPTLYDIPVVPEGHTWNDLRATSDNVDQTINEAFDALTEANPELEGIFQADYIDADALDDDRLGRLIEHLSTHDLDRDSVPPDMLGEAYMDLVRHFAEEEGKSGGQFFTPPHIVRLCVRLVDEFEDGDEFHDPTVGSGGMLTEAAQYYRDEQGGDPSKLRFTGQEINPDIAAIARMNLSIHALNGSIERQDSLGAPQFTDGDELERFDYVLANFPFSADWPKDDLQDDPYDRFDWHEKLPRADRGDYAFIMHMAKQLKQPDRDGSGGKAVIVVPHGVLSRENEQRYRKTMLEEDLVEAIIMLPDNLFQNNSIPSAILILNTNKAETRVGEIQFIYALDDSFYTELSNQNQITSSGMGHIIRNYEHWKREERVSRPVSIDEIRENNYNLNIALYIDTRKPEPDISVAEQMDRVSVLQKQRQQLEEKVESHLDELGYDLQVKLNRYETADSVDIINHSTDSEPVRMDLQQLDESPVVDWELQKMGDVLSLEYGNNLPAKSREDGSVPVYGSNGQVDTHSEPSVGEAGIILGRKGSIGEAEFSEEPFWPIDTTYYITKKETDENLRFLYYMLQDIQLERLNADSAIPGLNRNDAYGLNILVPPVAEQRKVASVLYTIDEAIDKTEQITGRQREIRGEDNNISLSGFEAIKKGLMQDLFSGNVRTTDTNIEVFDEVAQYG